LSLPFRERAEGDQAASVVVPDRDEEERILDRFKPEAGEELGPLGADPLEILKRGL